MLLCTNGGEDLHIKVNVAMVLREQARRRSFLLLHAVCSSLSDYFWLLSAFFSPPNQFFTKKKKKKMRGNIWVMLRLGKLGSWEGSKHGNNHKMSAWVLCGLLQGSKCLFGLLISSVAQHLSFQNLLMCTWCLMPEYKPYQRPLLRWYKNRCTQSNTPSVTTINILSFYRSGLHSP